MYVIVGLGNPGAKYEQTRHNAGFVFVERLVEFFGWDRFYSVADWEHDDGMKYEYVEAKYKGVVRILLVKPLTFMNTSGFVVQKIVSEYRSKISKDLIIAHDDLDIQLGSFKIQTGVSPKSHKGVKSIEHLLERRNFLRVRIGVDSRDGDRSVPGDEYVLEKMTEKESELLDEAVVQAVKNLRNSLML